MNPRRTKLSGFTLLETVVGLLIIVVLVSLTTTSIINLRSKAQDAKRLSDIREIQFALDRYASDNGGQYPSDSEVIPGGSLVSKNGHVVYMETIPHNSQPQTDGDCPNKDYQYLQGLNGRSYTLTYCLGNKTANLDSGPCVAMPLLLCARSGCSCEEVTKNCCGWCAVGSTCGGGTLFTGSFDSGSGTYALIVDKTIENVPLKWDIEGFSDTKAKSEADGVMNQAKLIGSKFATAEACATLNLNGHHDWYLPAINEVQALADAKRGDNSLLISPWTPHWSSTEIDTVNVYGFSNNARQSFSKASPRAYNCVRRNQ